MYMYLPLVCLERTRTVYSMNLPVVGRVCIDVPGNQDLPAAELVHTVHFWYYHNNTVKTPDTHAIQIPDVICLPACPLSRSKFMFSITLHPVDQSSQVECKCVQVCKCASAISILRKPNDNEHILVVVVGATPRACHGSDSSRISIVGVADNNDCGIHKHMVSFRVYSKP
jgi:hypothetical protein